MNIEMDNQCRELIKQNKAPSFFITDKDSYMSYLMGLREFFGGTGPIFGIPEKIELCLPGGVKAYLYQVPDFRSFVMAVELQ
jgi:hypothetical protein